MSRRLQEFGHRRAAIIAGGLLALVVFMTTVQVTINGSQHPYATDVGEIQNALPRWGTIHFPGYPLYSLAGSVFVTFFRFIRVEPAISASLFSAFWGAISIGLLIVLEFEFDVMAVAAVLAALAFALATSFWVDASIAEVHTLTMALMLASIIFALRFSRYGRRSDLLWLALFASQAVLHQRATVFMALGLLVLVLRQRQALWRGLPAVAGVAILSSLIYLYLPLRAWQGADWTFSQPGTWRGFWELVLDTKAERIVELPQSAGEWITRIQAISGILSSDWPLILLGLGLLGNLGIALRGSRSEALAILLIWLPYLIVSLIIWEGRISDALLAVNLPVLATAALGLGIVSSGLAERSKALGAATMGLLLIVLVFLFVDNRPTVLEITRDGTAATTIALAERITPAEDGRPITLMALWGNDYWALAYAQAFEDRLPGINLVDHNADLAKILDRQDHLLTFSRTFYLRPVSWWEQRFGRVFLSSYAPDIVEVRQRPASEGNNEATSQDFSLGNGIIVRSTELSWQSPTRLQLTVYWEAGSEELIDYSVAVHLVSKDPPEGQEDILSQADSLHPVGGWYPTSKWSSGEIIRDDYLLEVPAGSSPEAVRLSMYQVAEDGQFINTEWLSLAIP